MKVLITGANGQLGYDVVKLLQAQKIHVMGCNREMLDITDDVACVQAVQLYRPNVVVHCAAYTAVDEAEIDVEKAYRVNAVGTRNIVVAAEAIGAKIVYISTDYVFDGFTQSPYHEYDHTNPQSVYGKSKRAGEVLVQSLSSRYFIVRTSWVFGVKGHNFVKTMIKLSSEQTQISVVNDQIGSPTYTADLAHFISHLMITDRYGIYHASNTGECSWYEFACEIFYQLGKKIDIIPCTTDEFPRTAPRPKYSVMSTVYMQANDFLPFSNWKDALTRFLAAYKS
ncbi:dTDP-4-dehydrorhamnose reductase [Paenibacillus thiaminolyticus]|uniref:dTDP-4-dehydrorhamnose reductase n=1 Tax=Paenibacillus thiaminolyticus TaxID=49283 RepID=UPI0035A5F47D